MSWRRPLATDAERAIYNATTAFLDGRLNNRRTIDWALQLRPSQVAERLAVTVLLDHTRVPLKEPWSSALRLIEEAWDVPGYDRLAFGAYSLRQRLKSGERSGALIRSIVALVKPHLSVEPFSEASLARRNLPKRPTAVGHLFSTSVASFETVDQSQISLGDVSEPAFLAELVRALESSLQFGFDLAQRLGWEANSRLWRLGDLRSVYYLGDGTGPDEQDRDPDRFAKGIAPAAKLLHAAAGRLAEIAPRDAAAIIAPWRNAQLAVFQRLWAALARSPSVAPGDDVAEFLLGLDANRFWYLLAYPEIAELRAVRFADLDEGARKSILARLVSGPPRSQWKGEEDRKRVDEARRYWSVRELRRIEDQGNTLPRAMKRWLERYLPQFPDLQATVDVREGFLDGPKVRYGGSAPDRRYDDLDGFERLQALEAALAYGRRRWDDNPGEAAAAWISDADNASKVLVDLEASPFAGAAFPLVWERWGWLHSSSSHGGTKSKADNNLRDQGRRVLALLLQLPDDTVRRAIAGISHWLSAWERLIVADESLLPVWMKVWPLAVEATNAQQATDDDLDLNVVVRGSDEDAPRDLDTLNTPAGKLVGVFLFACPTLKKTPEPFGAGTAVRIMRDELMAVGGRAGLIAKHRMIEALPYFLRADPVWTKAELLPALLTQSAEALPLWRAVARARLNRGLIKILGESLLRQVLDERLGREPRQNLMFWIVVDQLHALNDGKRPGVTPSRLQQLLRALDDEVRAFAANTVQRFVKDMSTTENEKFRTPAGTLFRRAARPFLQNVWPQERSLSTPGVSKAFADLPAASGDAFADAVDVVERFVVPFDCWSLLDFGLYGDDEAGDGKLSTIDTPSKAQGLLTLLDRSIGQAEGAVVPFDLGQALGQIKLIAPELEASQAFRRLSTAAR